MRRLAAGLAGLLVIALGWTSVPAAASAATASPKIVLVVGATHDVTPTYRAWMDVVAATASKYSRNVVKVYSPNATWPAVRSALQGASIVVYMGHGNGFPSPYVTTPNPYAQNGMGLNQAAGAGDYNTKYYGEYYFSHEVDLAPNAVVILSHLCYASGNSEPGKTAPTLAMAKARIDNFAAGFLGAGARAVIADGHSDPSWYITQLFTTHKTIQQIWSSGPSPHGNTFSFASSRTPGYTAFSDPDTKTSTGYAGFYRSLVTRVSPALTSDQVTGAAYAPTDSTPGYFVVPGAAEVTAAAGVGLFPDATLTPDPATGLAPLTLPATTRLRITAAAGTTAAGVAIYAVTTLDGATSGFVAATGLAPRDSTPPRFWTLDAGTNAFSPNGDGSADTITLTGRASEAVTWNVAIADADGTGVAVFSGQGSTFSATWDGMVGGAPLPDGTYTATVTLTDPWGNAPATQEVPLTIDTVKPSVDVVTAQTTTPPVFTPNGDGTTDAFKVGFTASEAGTLGLTVRNAGGAAVDASTSTIGAGSGSVTWDGRTSAGTYVVAGTYTLALQPVDLAGNRGPAVTVAVVAFPQLGFVKTSPTMLYSRDRDALATSTTFSFRLTATATVTWQLSYGMGSPLITRFQARNLAAGTYTWTWDGRLPDGSYAPDGWYTSTVTATDGTTTVSQWSQVMVGAFRVILSDSTPTRGQLVTATIISSEPLRWKPVLTFTQPGRAPVAVATTWVAPNKYQASFRTSTAYPVGTLQVRIAGYDTATGYNATITRYPLN